MLYLLVRYWWCNDSFGKIVGLLYLCLAGLDVFLVWTLHRWAEDVDLTDPGLIEYMRDAVYASWIILVLGLATDYAYMLTIVMVGFIAYQMLGALPLGGGMPQEPVQESQLQRRKKGKATTAKPVSKSQRRAELGAEYRGGRRKF